MMYLLDVCVCVVGVYIRALIKSLILQERNSSLQVKCGQRV